MTKLIDGYFTTLRHRNISTWPELSINFWGVTKCASTTVKSYLMVASGRRFSEGGNPHVESRYITEGQALGNGLWNVGVTRDPYDRFVSAYQDIARDERKRLAAGIEEIPTMDELLDWVEMHTDEELDVHLKPQTCFLREQVKTIDISQVRCWPLDIDPPQGIKNASLEAKPRITEDQASRIAVRYADDFIQFGYGA